jgi:hypothetical protein
VSLLRLMTVRVSVPVRRLINFVLVVAVLMPVVMVMVMVMVVVVVVVVVVVMFMFIPMFMAVAVVSFMFMTVAVVSFMFMTVAVLVIMDLTFAFLCHHCYPGARYPVPLITGDVQPPSLYIQFLQTVDQSITADTQVDHRSQVHVTAYTRKTVIVKYFHFI